MGDLLNALKTETVITENGMTTNVTTLNSCLDLFFQIGAMRGQDEGRLVSMFSKAYNEDALVAMKLLFWSRDIRGGAGERKIFRVIADYLVNSHPESIKKNLKLIPEFGRWDDLLVFIGTKLESDVLGIIKDGLSDDNTKGLCAKWIPRPSGKNTKKRMVANTIRKYLGLSPKKYRKMLSETSNTVEQLMCSKSFDKIEYSKLPSKAMANLMKAFSKNDTERFGKYLEDLKSGDAKINAGAVYPYDIVKSLNQGNIDGADAQWDALPNFLEGNTEKLLPLVDVSFSMVRGVANNPNLNVLDIAISLGLYISERNVGPFVDSFLTFHSSPELIFLNGKLSDREKQMRHSEWGGSTNLFGAYQMILEQATKFNIPPSEMPTMMIVLSDMEFNKSDRGWDETAQQGVKRMFNECGYELPKIVYWNLASRQSNMPVQHREDGTALISGFSPSILKNVLNGSDMNPLDMMYDVINTERYENIKI